MTQSSPIPRVAIVEAVSRNGQNLRQFGGQHMRHTLAVRGRRLPEDEHEAQDNREPESERKVSGKDIREAWIEVAKKHSQLCFEILGNASSVRVMVLDRDSGEPILQVPGDRAMAMAEHLLSLEADKLGVGNFHSSRV